MLILQHQRTGGAEIWTLHIGAKVSQLYLDIKIPLNPLPCLFYLQKNHQDLRGSMLGIVFLHTKKQFHSLSATQSVHIEYGKHPSQDQIALQQK